MPPPTANPSNSPRILYLDGLRFVAILSVISFHYFSAWTPPHHLENFYPYGNIFSSCFQYGYYGVHLFFIVSGFVITLTLYKCPTAREFAIRRFARLWPSMLLCSLISFLLLRILPVHFFLPSPLGFIPSLTFLDPRFFNALFSTQQFQWIDGVYWTLFVEVRFYLLVAVIYFAGKGRFIQNICIYSVIVLALSPVLSHFHVHSYIWFNMLFFADYLPWFLLGIGFYLLENRLQPRLNSILFTIAFFALLGHAALNHSYSELAIIVLLPLLVLAAARIVLLNRILSLKLLTNIGAASYSLYLLHQRLGVSLIGWLGNLLKFTGPYSVLLAVVTASILILTSRLIYVFWESPFNHMIVSRFAARSPRPSPITDSNC